MSHDMKSHPEPGLLLQYVDDALGEAERKEILDHLAGCAECRESMTELESGVEDYRRDWLPALKTVAEAPPKPWFEIRGQLQRLDRPAAKPAAKRAWFDMRWAAAAAAAVFAIILFFSLTERPLSAAQLLRDAASREAAFGAVRTPIRITSRSGSIGEAELRMRFEQANYGWENPLSARTFSQWRSTLSDATDEVARVSGDDGTPSYELTTRTAAGTLAEASLRFRASDLHAIEGRLRFRDNEVVDIAEVPATPAAPPDMTVKSPNSGKPVAAPDAATVTPGDELRVWAALRRIDADLGEPIEVDRDSSGVVVTALGLSPQRRRALEGALNGLPNVEVRFKEFQPVRDAGQKSQDNAVTAPQPGARIFTTEFIDSALEAAQSAVLRAHALRKLAERYPLEVEAQLSAADRGLLVSLLAEHYDGFDAAARRVLDLGRQITLSASSQASPLQPRTWQDRARGLVDASQRVDEILTKLLAEASAVDQKALTSELEAGLRRLESEMQRAR